MDIAKRDALLRRSNYTGSNDCFPAVVTLEEFFEGNDDLGSLWYNLLNQPENIETIRVFLENLRARADVNDLKILITKYDDDPDEWPVSDTVVIDTEADPEEVASWFGDFKPDEVEYSDWAVRKLTGFKNCIAAWWD